LFASDVAGITLDQVFDRPPESVPVVRLFCGKGLLAFSDRIEQEMLAGGRAAAFCTRTVLDTNFLSELPRLCESKISRAESAWRKHWNSSMPNRDGRWSGPLQASKI